MAVLFVEGFDKYGPAGQATPAVPTLLTASEWTSATNATYAIAAGLSAGGQALQIPGNGQMTKTLAASYGRLIGGVRFSVVLSLAPVALQIQDAGTAQCSIVWNSAGTIALRNGSSTGTVIATSTATITTGSTHYLEWDITFSATGAYQVWLDGVSILSGTGNTKTTANNYANQINFYGGGSGVSLTLDDLYLFDSTGATCNAVLLNNPIVETAFPSGDAQKQWTGGASIIGVDNSATTTNFNQMTLNRVYVRPYTAAANMTLNSISVMPAGSNGTMNLRPVVYAGVAAGATLLASGPNVTGATSGTAITMPLTTPLAISSGTTYGIGIQIDSTIAYAQSDNGSASSYCAATFGSGAPSTLGAMTAAQSFQMWGNCTGSASDFVSININPAVDDVSYLFSSTVGQQEMQSFPALNGTPASIACVAYKARLKRSDSGTRTVEVHCASGAADSAGSTAGGVTPGTSYAWVGNYQSTDPNTGTAWTGTGVNAATGGTKVLS